MFDRKLHYLVNETKEGSWDAIENNSIQSAIKALGHDSFYVNEDGIKNLGVYSPQQIKSATGNRGTFDPKSSKLNEARGGSIIDKALMLTSRSSASLSFASHS